MARPLTEKELDAILKNPPYRSLLGLNSPVFVKKLDIYSGHLMSEFSTIDKKYHLISKQNKNKGKKGELVLCGIIDLTMWRFGFCLGRDYKVIYGFGGDHYSKEGGMDFRLECNGWIFLCEAKNWHGTYVDKKTYQETIQTRFRFLGINVLMIREDKIKDVLKLSQKYPPFNKQPINFLRIHNSMLDKINNEEQVSENLLGGVEQLVVLISPIIGQKIQDKEYTLDECLQMGMPTWFIREYTRKSDKTINRMAKKLYINRKCKKFTKMTNYRLLK